MSALPDRLFENVLLCRESRLYAQLLHNSIFATISDQTTQTQYAAAAQSIRDLGARLSATLDPFHFGALTGTHQCIPEVAELACAYLANLAIMQPELPRPTPPPPPRPQPLSNEDLMRYVERWIAQNTQQTFFGDVAEGADDDAGSSGT